MGRFKIIIVLTLGLFLLAACSRSGAVEVGEKAPDFSIQDTGGNTVNLADFKGKVIILDFFGTWCPPCREEIPDFIELQKSYGPSGLAIIGVSNETPQELRGFVNASGINYPVLVDSAGNAHQAYGPIRAIPSTFIIDREFTIRRHYIGARPREVFENDIKEMLK